jgi:hypothetical protein
MAPSQVAATHAMGQQQLAGHEPHRYPSSTHSASALSRRRRHEFGEGSPEMPSNNHEDGSPTHAVLRSMARVAAATDRHRCCRRGPNVASPNPREPPPSPPSTSRGASTSSRTNRPSPRDWAEQIQRRKDDGITGRWGASDIMPSVHEEKVGRRQSSPDPAMREPSEPQQASPPGPAARIPGGAAVAVVRRPLLKIGARGRIQAKEPHRHRLRGQPDLRRPLRRQRGWEEEGRGLRRLGFRESSSRPSGRGAT